MKLPEGADCAATPVVICVIHRTFSRDVIPGDKRDVG
jgi:hypothetical protein